ncbi:hypothetical protein HGRIS_001285 [Hohenbuehelia grisea]|uniref:Uncharacterized protein n=1 Tax=Hohenbuehelia grisea TaxID=104357 RepID=A0ABR3JP18_9AGAR
MRLVRRRHSRLQRKVFDDHSLKRARVLQLPQRLERFVHVQPRLDECGQWHKPPHLCESLTNPSLPHVSTPRDLHSLNGLSPALSKLAPGTVSASATPLLTQHAGQGVSFLPWIPSWFAAVAS